MWFHGANYGILHINDRRPKGGDMSQEAFRLLSRAMRYVFVLIAALYFLLTVLWMRRDQRQWKKEKKNLPDAGTVGELVDEDSLKRYPVPREGTIGSARRCDIRVIGHGVKRLHADIRFADGKGLMIIPARGAKILLNGEPVSSRACAGRDSRLKIGSASLVLKLLKNVDAPARGVFGDGYDPPAEVVPGADGWARVVPLPEKHAGENPGEDWSWGDEFGAEEPEDPFRGVAPVPSGRAMDDGGEDETQE